LHQFQFVLLNLFVLGCQTTVGVALMVTLQRVVKAMARDLVTKTAIRVAFLRNSAGLSGNKRTYDVLVVAKMVGLRAQVELGRALQSIVYCFVLVIRAVFRKANACSDRISFL